MGLDIDVFVLYGYRIPLNVAFELNLLNPEIVQSDDYQLLNFGEDLEEIIERNVASQIPDDMVNSAPARLKKWILSSQSDLLPWNMYILTSSQEDCNPSESYLFVYNHKEELYNGRVPDYKTGELSQTLMHGVGSEHEASIFPEEYRVYKKYWIVEGSW